MSKYTTITFKSIISAVLCAALLTGCAAHKAAALSGESEETAALSAEPEETAALSGEVGETSGASGQDEEIGEELPEPNIVDDNYRNYYEIFVGSYCDSNGDGIGDLRGIESRLDYISDLGCNGIWLTPIMTAPSYHKYDTSDYYSVDPAFGTNDDFKALAEACHERGIRLIIDMVINHSSNEHPWFKEACDYLRSLPGDAEPDPSVCPYVEYYNFSREKVNSSYCEVSGSDWYYEAVFYYTQPDLNLYNEALEDELENIAAFWIEAGCDGFRMDAAMHYDDSASSYNIDFLKRYYSYCTGLAPDFYMVSEVWASEKVIAEYYKSDTPSFFNFDAAGTEGKLIRAGRGKLDAEKFVRACLDYQNTFKASNPDCIDAPFITNHDMGRVSNALMNDPVSLKMTAGLLLTMSGSPFIYYGEEIGMNSKGSADENKRLHMNWGEGAEGICSDPSGADEGIEQKFPSVAEQTQDEGSILSYYKKALAIRNAYPEIARGETQIVENVTDSHIALIAKKWMDECIYIAYNTSDDELRIDMEAAALGDVKIITGLYAADGTDKADMDGHTLVVPGRSIVFIK